MAIELVDPISLINRSDNATSFGSDSIVYIAKCDLTEGLTNGKKVISGNAWKQFPCAIEETLTMEPKTGELLDDRGRVVYSYSQPSKVKYAFSIFQRDKDTFNFLRNCSGETYALWVVVGQVGTKYQEILMYGKIGANYSENMNADPKIPIEFNCQINTVKITASKPRSVTCYATEIVLPANKMIVKQDTAKPNTSGSSSGESSSL